MSRDDMTRVTRECLKKGIPMPTQLEPCAVWEGYMARAIQELTSMRHPEGDWRVEKIMEATGEAEKEAEGLKTEPPQSKSSATAHALASPDKLKAGQQGCRDTRRGQETATAGKLPKLKYSHASLRTTSTQAYAR